LFTGGLPILCCMIFLDPPFLLSLSYFGFFAKNDKIPLRSKTGQAFPVVVSYAGGVAETSVNS